LKREPVFHKQQKMMKIKIVFIQYQVIPRCGICEHEGQNQAKREVNKYHEQDDFARQKCLKQ
jgi:hypothetical protein